MKYLFDTDSINFFYKKSLPQHKSIQSRVLSLSEDDTLQISVLSIFESEYSLFLAPNDKKEDIKKLIKKVKGQFNICSLTEKSATIYGEIKGKLKTNRNMTSENMKKHNIDIMLASTAIVESAILISNDKIYEDIASNHPEFKYDNWLVF